MIKSLDSTNRMLGILRACSMSNRQIEQLALAGISIELEGTACTPLEVHFSDTKRITFFDAHQAEQTSIRAMPIDGRGQIQFRNPGEAKLAVANASNAQISLGKLLELREDYLIFSLALLEGKSFMERKAAKSRAIDMAKERAHKVAPGCPLYSIAAKWEVDFSDARKYLRRGSSPQTAEQALIKALGGPARGVVAVALNVDPTSSTVLWGDEIVMYIREEDLATALCDRAKTWIRSPEGSEIARLKLASSHNVKIQRVAKSESEAQVSRDTGAAARKVTGLDEVKNQILSALQSECPATFPSRTKDDQPIVWSTEAAKGEAMARPQTIMDDLPDAMDERDLRNILDNMQITCAEGVLLTAIKQLIGEKVICLVPPEGNGPYEVWTRVAFEDEYRDD